MRSPIYGGAAISVVYASSEVPVANVWKLEAHVSPFYATERPDGYAPNSSHSLTQHYYLKAAVQHRRREDWASAQAATRDFFTIVALALDLMISPRSPN